jgi:hypothetical protein
VDDGRAARNGFNTVGVELVVNRLPNAIVFASLGGNGPCSNRLSAFAEGTLQLF